MPPRPPDPNGPPPSLIGFFLYTRVARTGMIIKRVGGLDICLEVDRSGRRRGERGVGDGKGYFEGLVDLDLRGAIVGDFACCIYYVRPFPAIFRARCEAG